MIINQDLANAGVPATGQSAVITIYEDGNATPVISAQAMTEYGNGFYYYDFTGYNQRKRYQVYIDGGVGLPNASRYLYQKLAYNPI